MCKLIKKINFPKNNKINVAKDIYGHTININLALFSILLAFYIAFVVYFVPQLHQHKINRELEFNTMLSAISYSIPGEAHAKDYPQYYKNDTVDFDKISYDISMTSLINGGDYKKSKVSKQTLSNKITKIVDAFKLINLICNEPVLDGTDFSYYEKRNHISFDINLYDKIEKFVRYFSNLKLMTCEIGVRLVVGSLSDSVLIDTNGRIMYGSEKYITINERTLLGDLYLNFDRIHKQYFKSIDNLNFKIHSLENMVSTLKAKTIILSVFWILFFNIIGGIFLQIHISSTKIATIHLFQGLIPYFIIGYKIITISYVMY